MKIVFCHSRSRIHLNELLLGVYEINHVMFALELRKSISFTLLEWQFLYINFCFFATLLRVEILHKQNCMPGTEWTFKRFFVGVGFNFMPIYATWKVRRHFPIFPAVA